MSKLSLFSLLGMIIVACTIGVMYIKPTVADIRAIEDTTSLHRDEILKVSEVNENLSRKLITLEAISPADNQALEKYLPDSVDEVAVMKDISTIFSSVGVSLDGLTYTLPTVKNNNADSDIVDPYQGLAQYDFIITATLDSQQLLRALNAIEVNEYLLQVTNLKINPAETTAVLKVSLVLTAFSRAEVVVTKE